MKRRKVKCINCGRYGLNYDEKTKRFQCPNCHWEWMETKYGVHILLRVDPFATPFQV